MSEFDYQGPGGEVPEGSRSPWGDQGDIYVGPPPPGPLGVQPPGPPGIPPEHRDPGRRRERRRQNAWRPIVVYVGDVSADASVGLLLAPFSGIQILRLVVKVRGTKSADKADYWKIGLYLVDTQGNEELLEEVTTETTAITAGINFEVFDHGGEVRLEENHELILKLTKENSPSALTGVQAYLDAYMV